MAEIVTIQRPKKVPHSDIWVIDTSAIVEIRNELNLISTDQKRVFEQLDKDVSEDRLFFPAMVHFEFLRGIASGDPQDDIGSIWTYKHLDKMKPLSPSHYDIQQLIDSNDELAKMGDPDKPYTSDGVEDADPHVLTMADQIRAQTDKKVKILTCDRKNKHGRISLTTAANFIEIVCLPAGVYLRAQKII